MRATLTNYKQSPRKVRLVADLVRGKSASDALTELTFLDKRAADPIKKLLTSAVANAKENSKIEKENLFIKEITVDEGMTIKRWMPVWRGSVHPINRRRSNIKIVLGEKTVNKPEETANKK